MIIKEQMDVIVNNIGEIVHILAQLHREAVNEPFKEASYVVGMSPSGSILYVDLVSLGTATGVIMEPRDIFRQAIVRGSCSIVIAHNHIGDLLPSVSDVQVAKELVKGGALLGIPVVDTIVFDASTGEYVNQLHEMDVDEVRRQNEQIRNFAYLGETILTNETCQQQEEEAFLDDESRELLDAVVQFIDQYKRKGQSEQ